MREFVTIKFNSSDLHTSPSLNSIIYYLLTSTLLNLVRYQYSQKNEIRLKIAYWNPYRTMIDTKFFSIHSSIF